MPKERKSLIQLQRETTVRDPAAHAKHQVTELDKTAKRSLEKRRQCTEQIEADKKELAHIEEQIHNIRIRYDPLVKHLEERKEKRATLLKTLDECVKQERMIMGETQGIVHTRRMDDSKLLRNMATSTLQSTRGYSLDPSSTFHQSRENTTKKLPTIKNTR